MRGIILEIDSYFLAELLHLPVGARIDDIQKEINTMDDMWLIKVRNMGPDVPEGNIVSRARGEGSIWKIK